MSNAGESLQAFVETDLIRQVELEISKRYHPSDDPTDSPMKNPVHLSIGQEHVPVAVAMAVGEDAHAYGTHRSHAAYLAWGGDLDAMIAELYGKETGCAGGWGGSMHLIDEAVRHCRMPLVTLLQRSLPVRAAQQSPLLAMLFQRQGSFGNR
jgi:pyruvate dehydrogenase E1 component alpha subunit